MQQNSLHLMRKFWNFLEDFNFSINNNVTYKKLNDQK